MGGGGLNSLSKVNLPPDSNAKCTRIRSFPFYANILCSSPTSLFHCQLTEENVKSTRNGVVVKSRKESCPAFISTKSQVEKVKKTVSFFVWFW